MTLTAPDLSEVPRVYASFEDFERDERRRLGLPALLPAPASAPSLAIVPVAKQRTALTARVTPEALREEGVLVICCPPGTSVVFVQTKVQVHLFHAAELPDRKLDDYAVALAVTWIESHGLPSYQVARNLGVSEPTLRKALAAAGYERLSSAQQQACATARAARKPGRRGRLVRVSTASPA